MEEGTGEYNSNRTEVQTDRNNTPTFRNLRITIFK